MPPELPESVELESRSSNQLQPPRESITAVETAKKIEVTLTFIKALLCLVVIDLVVIAG
jgi:hypothetical protein